MKSALQRVRQHLASLVLVCAAGPAAAQTAIDTRIDGLPAGLSLQVELVNVYCNGPANSRINARALTEQTLVTWETAPLPGGGFQLVQRVRTSYVTQFPQPTLPACGGSGINEFRLVVLGMDGTRTAPLRNYVGGMTQLQKTMEAKTTELFNLVNQNATPLAPLTRGTSVHWVARYSDSMGFESVVEPTLDFLAPSNFPLPGSLASVARLSINRDGAVCVRSGGATTCRAKALGGLLTVGAITVDVRNTTHSGGSTSWRFTLLPGFPTTVTTVRAAANDLDDIEYRVDNEGALIDLLPWKSLSLPVF